MSYYLGARDMIELVKYYAEKSKSLKDFFEYLDKLEKAVAERRIHVLREQLFLDL